MKLPIRFAVLGNSTFSEKMGSGFIRPGIQCVYAFSNSEKQLPAASSGISDWAFENEIPFMELDDANSPDFSNFLSHLDIDFLAVSWPKILSTQILSIPRIGCIGTHPTQLPFGRGRHPLHWLIAMGAGTTSLTFFMLNKGVDTGEILLQLPIEIESIDDINSLSKKIDELAYKGASILGQMLKDGESLPKLTQQSLEGSYWRKRGPTDLQIDCRMSREIIIRLVRSYTSPFNGAILVGPFGEQRVVDASAIDTGDEDWRLHALGTILNTSDHSIDMRVDNGVIRLTLQTSQVQCFKKSDVVYPPAHYYRKS
jgi:methionyl-tRNA formyltransferase